MKEIVLTQGRVAVVDDEDFYGVNAFKWYVRRTRHGRWYALRNINVGGERKTLFMHRFIMGLPPAERLEIDHKDCNGLNNCRDNLRWATRAENIRNLQGRCDNKSGLKGVRFVVRGNYRKWEANIKAEGKQVWLGGFATPQEAARAYDSAAIRYYGAFARINYPE